MSPISEKVRSYQVNGLSIRLSPDDQTRLAQHKKSIANSFTVSVGGRDVLFSCQVGVEKALTVLESVGAQPH